MCTAACRRSSGHAHLAWYGRSRRWPIPAALDAWASVAMFDSDVQVIAVLATHSDHQDEPKQVLTAHTSSGLAGMVERVRLLEGQLTIESAPGQGTRLIAELPLGDSLT